MRLDYFLNLVPGGGGQLWDWITRWGLKGVPQEYRSNKEVVLQAVRHNGANLEYASDELRKDEEVVYAAVLNDGNALQFADEQLRDSKDLIVKIVKMQNCAFRYIGSKLLADRKFVIKVIRAHHLYLEDLPKELKRDLGAVLESIKRYDWISKDLIDRLEKGEPIPLSEIGDPNIYSRLLQGSYPKVSMKKDFNVTIIGPIYPDGFGDVFNHLGVLNAVKSHLPSASIKFFNICPKEKFEKFNLIFGEEFKSIGESDPNVSIEMLQHEVQYHSHGGISSLGYGGLVDCMQPILQKTHLLIVSSIFHYQIADPLEAAWKKINEESLVRRTIVWINEPAALSPDRMQRRGGVESGAGLRAPEQGFWLPTLSKTTWRDFFFKNSSFATLFLGKSYKDMGDLQNAVHKYRQTHNSYLSYNREKKNLKLFLSLIAGLNKGSGKTVDIVLPMIKSEDLQAIVSFVKEELCQKQSLVSNPAIFYDGTLLSQKTTSGDIQEDSRTFRLLAFSGLARHQFTDLLQLVDAPVGITGNGSLSEAIVAKQSFFYDRDQKNGYTEKLFRHLLCLALERSTQYRKFQEFFKDLYLITENDSLPVGDAVKLGISYKENKDEIDAGFKDLSQLIESQYNAGTNITALFNEILSIKDSEDEDFKKNLLSELAAGELSLPEASKRIKARFSE